MMVTEFLKFSYGSITTHSHSREVVDDDGCRYEGDTRLPARVCVEEGVVDWEKRSACMC